MIDQSPILLLFSQGFMVILGSILELKTMRQSGKYGTSLFAAARNGSEKSPRQTFFA
jgi:hypothetical protein